MREMQESQQPLHMQRMRFRGSLIVLGVLMGQVAATLKVMPESPDSDIEQIKDGIRKIHMGDAHIKEMKVENMAFGLKMIMVLFVMPDHGGTDKLEDQIKAIPGVSEVETGEITLL